MIWGERAFMWLMIVNMCWCLQRWKKAKSVKILMFNKTDQILNHWLALTWSNVTTSAAAAAFGKRISSFSTQVLYGLYALFTSEICIMSYWGSLLWMLVELMILLNFMSSVCIFSIKCHFFQFLSFKFELLLARLKTANIVFCLWNFIVWIINQFKFSCQCRRLAQISALLNQSLGRHQWVLLVISL